MAEVIWRMMVETSSSFIFSFLSFQQRVPPFMYSSTMYRCVLSSKNPYISRILLCLVQLWIRIQRANWSTIILDFIKAFGIFFKANSPLLFLCLTKFTQPNLPSPSFLSMVNSSIRPPLVLCTVPTEEIFFLWVGSMVGVRSCSWWFLSFLSSMKGELNLASQLPLSTLGVRKQLEVSSLFLLGAVSFQLLQSRCRKVGERWWLTFLSRSLPCLGSLLAFLSSQIICLLRLILSLSRSQSLRLEASSKLAFRCCCRWVVSLYLLYLSWQNQLEQPQSGMRVSLQAFCDLKFIVCRRNSFSLFGFYDYPSPKWFFWILPTNFEFMVCRREAVYSVTFLRLSNSRKSEARGQGLVGKSWGCLGESQRTYFLGLFLKLRSK